MGVWAGPDWPEAGLRTKPPGSPYLGPERRAVPRCSPRHPGPATPSPRGPSPGRGAAGDPLPAREQRPVGTMGPLPRLEAGRYKGREARPGSEPGVRKVQAEEGEGKGGDGGGRGSPRAAPPAGRGAARSPTAAAEAGTHTSSLSTPGRQGLHTKRSGTPNLRQGRGPPDALCPPTVSRACPARAPRGPGPRGAPLSRTHPQLRAPAHGGT